MNEATGWAVFENNRTVPIVLYVEPYGVGWPLAPGEAMYIYLYEDDASTPVIHYWDDSIQVYASRAVLYLGDEKVFDWHDLNLGRPTG